MIHPSTIEEIKNRVDIVEVVGDFVTLKRSGSSFKALSPFTNEKTPSFYVVPSKGIFKDFSSGKGGDAITFVMEVDGLSYVEALKYLAAKYGIEVKEEEQSDEALEAQNKRESLYIVLNYANEYFQRVLHDSDEGMAIGGSYFKERGFTEETIKKFQLGYSKELWDGLMNEAIQKGYQKELLAEAGLIIDKEGKSYDRFRSRVMFPIHNVSGKAIAFGGRKLSSTDKSAKYINSPETDLYNKSKVLYGLYFSKNAIRKEDNCFLVEGYTDVISMHQAGIENVVASSGTALTEEQVKLIKRYSQNVTVIFDGDAAGIKASMRGIDLLLEGDLNVKAVALPEGEDPDSYARNLGANGFKDFVEEESQDIIRFKTHVLLDESGNDPIKKANVIKDIVATISNVKDNIKRSLYIKETSLLLGINEGDLIVSMNREILSRGKEDFNEIKSSPISTDKISWSEINTKRWINAEKFALQLLLNWAFIEFVSSEGKRLLIEYFVYETEDLRFNEGLIKDVFLKFFESYLDNRIDNLDSFIDSLSRNEKQFAYEIMFTKWAISENWKEKYNIHVPLHKEDLSNLAKQSILRMKLGFLRNEIFKLNNNLKLVADSPEKTDELLDDIIDYKSIELEIATLLKNDTA